MDRKEKISTFVLGEFTTTEQLLAAGRALREANLGVLDAYSPYPVHGIEDALAIPRSIVPKIALTGGVTGACAGFFMQYWMNAVDYPINIAGRSMGLSGWPTNIPITFECGILFTALSIFFGSMALFGAPRPYHPVFESEAFRSASVDRFWISIETDRTGDALAQAEQKMREVGAQRVETVRGPTE